MAYDRIMVGTDGSDTAQRAEEAAARLAKACEAQLYVVSAFEKSADVADVLGRAERRAREHGLTEVRTEMQRGKAADVLVEMSDQQDVDLLVLGDRGMSGGRRFIMGSVAGSVAEQGRTDILIVRTTAGRPPERPWGEYRNVLIGTDGSSTADRATRRGLELARRIGAAVTLLYVGFPDTGDAILRETAERLDAGEVRAISRPGNPAEVLIGAAESEDADLLVVGNKGMGSGRFRLGSVPDKVAHNASKDVLVVKTATLSLEEVGPGEGAVVTEAGQKLAVYVAEDGTRTVLSAKCTHLGCTVGWNASERTWDCPCHGSRFALEGEVVNGPASKPLPRIEA